MPARKRAYIEVSAALLKRAGGYATWEGEIPEFVHAMVIAAAQVAEAGHHDLLPPAIRRGAGPKDGTPIRFATTAEDQNRYWSALYAAGSSPAAVATASLDALIAAKGRRMDVVTPWTPRLRHREPSDDEVVADSLCTSGAA